MQCMLSSTVRRLSRITRGPCSIIIPVHARLLTVPNALRIANYPRSHYGSFTAAGCFQPFFPTPTVFSSVPSARAIRSDTGIWPSAHWYLAFSTLVSGLQHTGVWPAYFPSAHWYLAFSTLRLSPVAQQRSQRQSPGAMANKTRGISRLVTVSMLHLAERR